MQAFWITFADGSKGCCEGQSAYDAVNIAEKMTGKAAVIGDNKYQPDVPRLPYPATPIIWQFDHPLYGKTPPFCMTPDQCKGKGSCPRNRACDD